MEEHNNNNDNNCNNFQGDLTDIVLRASGHHHQGAVVGAASSSSSSSSSNSHHHNHNHVVVPSCYEQDLLLPNNMANNNNNWQQLFSSSDPIMNCFGDPFSNMRDPLLHELNNMSGHSSGLFGSPNSTSTTVNDLVNGCSSGGGFWGGGAGANGLIGPSHEEFGMKMKMMSHGGSSSTSLSTTTRPSTCSNIFSRMLQINPTSTTSKLPCNTLSSQCDSALSPSPPPPLPVASPREINVNSSQSGGCLLENNSTGCLQISSPRNPGIKRR